MCTISLYNDVDLVSPTGSEIFSTDAVSLVFDSLSYLTIHSLIRADPTASLS